jgi:Rieske Fe-S protein
MMKDNPRRLLLRVATKLMAMAALLFFASILLLNLRCSGDLERPVSTQTERVQVSSSQALQRIPWSGGNVLVLYRDAEQLAQLELANPQLRDPDSQSAQQPPGLAVHRAKRASHLVLFDRGGEMACPLEWLPPDHRLPPHQPWPGGFREICQNTWYDAAGRAYGSGRSARNIPIPAHHWQGQDLLILGHDGDNRAPRP